MKNLQPLIQRYADKIQLKSGAEQVVVIAFHADDGGHLAVGARVTHRSMIRVLLQKLLEEIGSVDPTELVDYRKLGPQ